MNKETTLNHEVILPLKPVYSYYFPEVRQIIDHVVTDYPHEIFLQSITPGLDDFHLPVIDAYQNHVREQLPELNQFPYRYVTGGASEGIFHLLAQIAAFKKNQPLYVLEGEYEGYAGYGQNLGLNFTTTKETTDLINTPPGIVFLSNPSARDGNIIKNEEVLAICNAGHQVVYDATYVGLTDPHRFDLNHQNIIAVITSLSKPFGLYYHRLGFTFTRFEMKTLEVNKWFKNILSLIIAREVLTQIKPGELVRRYRFFQKAAISQMEKDFSFKPNSSDVVLLANTDNKTFATDQKSVWEKFHRRHNYRFCLTPYYLDQEKTQNEKR